MPIMRQPATGFVLVLWFSAFSGWACYAQDKKACELITKADVDSVYGMQFQEDFFHEDLPGRCVFFTPRSGAVEPRTLVIRVSRSPAPVPTAVEDMRRLYDSKYQDLPGFADYALWLSEGKAVSLIAFKGGTIMLQMDTYALDGNLSQLRTLAAKALGGPEKTGYVYAGPAKGGAAQPAASRPAPGGKTISQAPDIATIQAQKTPACQLISKSSLETIMGFQLSDPKIVPVEDKLLPFAALPRIIASSSCQIHNVGLTVWYMQNADPENARDTFFRSQEENLRGRIKGRVLGYPSLFASPGSSTYIFTGGPNGLMILRINSSVSVRDDEKAYLNRATEIASGIWGPPAKLTGIVPNDQVVPQGEMALKGQTGMSVIITLDGMPNLSEPRQLITGIHSVEYSDFRTDIVAQLERVGITVFPRNDPPKYPVLAFEFSGKTGPLLDPTFQNRAPTVFTIFNLSLSFKQLFPTQAATGARFVEATMWQAESYGAIPAVQIDQIRDKVATMATGFAAAWQKANGKK
jgi:hypothetical protein